MAPPSRPPAPRPGPSGAAGEQADGRATLARVAARAGVSPATVSRALNRPGAVRAATRRRVLAAAEAVGYRPNLAARGLVTGRSGLLGVLVPDVANPFFASLVQAAGAEARRRGAALVVGDSGRDAAVERELAASLGARVDGLVVCAPRGDVAALRRAAGALPLVTVNRASAGIPGVEIAQRALVERAVAHLRGLGHRRLVFLAGPTGSWSSSRREEAARAQDGAQGARVRVLGPFDPTFEGGRGAADAALETSATGWIAFNDVMALGVLARLAERGVAVPEERSVVGSDDVPLAAMVTPALTTVRAPVAAVGRSAVELLGRLLDQEEAGEPPVQDAVAEHVAFEGELVVRASTGPPPTRASASPRSGGARPDEETSP